MLYASLTGPLMNIYFPVPTDDKEVARVMMNTSKLKHLWCSIYTADEVVACIAKHGGQVLDDEYAGRLDYDSHQVNVLRFTGLITDSMEQSIKAKAIAADVLGVFDDHDHTRGTEEAG